MGYRSHVMALVYPDAEDKERVQELYGQLKFLMATTFKGTIDGTAGVEGFAGHLTWMDSAHVLKFDLPDVKWYEGYADVDAFGKMMKAFHNEIEGYCTEFVRIGEESGDVEERRWGENIQYYLSVRQEVDCNV
jgi:hypothetical protein